ncbi:Abortive infection protein [Allomuricauda ruestringensis DSM 13258]|uniref:Abortive infection protein n=2 Tax=Flagellimonas TaxID=444459 RepID=G2PQQ0_ALLRU|nr:Abortive infection protein [Allomuricauda ruestringensis DSM 13258]
MYLGLNHTGKIMIVTFGAFLLYWVLDDLYFNRLRSYLDLFIGQRGISHILAYTLSALPLLFGVWLVHKKWNFARYLGLNGNIGKALLLSGVFTAPMFIGYYLAFDVNTEITVNQLLVSVIAAGFFEEVFFRGFLFGQLYRFTRMGFVPAIFIGALWFGAIHLYQSHDLNSALGIFGITFLGAVLFGWLYTEWENNLWMAIFSHSLMNLSWLLFSVDENAMGGWYANLFRLISIVLMILLTIYSKSHKNRSMAINRRTIWMKK